VLVPKSYEIRIKEYLFFCPYQILTLRLLRSVLPVGITDLEEKYSILERLLRIIGDTATICYPDTNVYSPGTYSCLPCHSLVN
jgi:hypothetical protein